MNSNALGSELRCYNMSMQVSLNNTGSITSLILVVNMIILSSPKFDHSPLMKLSNQMKLSFNKRQLYKVTNR